MRLLRSLLPAALALAALPAHAGDLLQMQVVDRDQGNVLPEYAHRGDTWIAGTPSHRYAVRLTNTSGGRLLVVLSVDGVNAVSGETAAASQRGYVLAPGETAEITGWRKSMQGVAQFVFTSVPDSYAARTGRPDDIGVIGAAVFTERTRWRPVYPAAPPIARNAPMEKSAMGADAAEEAAPQRIGTGHGDAEWSPVTGTTFERASPRPAEIVAIRYDDVVSLRRLGILPRPWGPRPHAPRPFPGGFVPDPPLARD